MLCKSCLPPSLLTRGLSTVEIDTTDLHPEDILTAFFRVARVHLTEHDLLRMATEDLPDSTMTPKL